MNTSDSDNARKFQQFKQRFVDGSIPRSKNDTTLFSLDLTESEKEELSALFVKTDIIVDELEKIKHEVFERSQIDSLRIDIWQAAAEQHGSEKELMERLFRIIGPFFSLRFLSYYTFNPEGDALLDLQWSKEGMADSHSFRIPKEITAFFVDMDYAIIEAGTLPEALPEHIKQRIVSLLDTQGVRTFLAIHYPNKRNPKGYLSFSRVSNDRAWNDKEIAILVELTKILSLKSSQIEAEDRLVRANTDLERKVSDNTEQLKKALVDLRQDIESREESEKALKESEELYRTLIRTCPDSIILTGLDLNIIMVNDAVLTINELVSEDILIGRNAYEFIAPHDLPRAMANAQRLIETGEMVWTEYTALKQNGSSYPAEFCVSMLKDENGKPKAFIAVVRDLTHRKMIEENLLTTRNLESLGTLAGGIAHDFNNILTVLVTNLALVKMSAGPEKPDVCEHIANAENAITKATKLTNQLLTFAKGGSPLKECGSVAEIIEETLELTLSGSNISWTTNIQEDLWQVEIDKPQIYQVINNIVFNAKESMPLGGAVACVVNNTTIESKRERRDGLDMILEQGDYVRVSIKDEGCGIPKAILDRIFDPFFSTKRHGRGLGLASVYSIIIKHGGYIGVNSETGKGTDFVFYLPAIRQQKDEQSVPSATRECSTARILIMDDDVDIGHILSKVLLKLGYSTLWVQEGSSAIEEYRKSLESKSPFDVVIMDLTIRGGMGGKEASKEILKLNPDVKIIVSSGYSNDPIMANYESYGFADVLTKPYSIDRMLDVIGKLLRTNGR